MKKPRVSRRSQPVECKELDFPPFFRFFQLVVAGSLLDYNEHAVIKSDHIPRLYMRTAKQPHGKPNQDTHSASRSVSHPQTSKVFRDRLCPASSSRHLVISGYIPRSHHSVGRLLTCFSRILCPFCPRHPDYQQAAVFRLYKEGRIYFREDNHLTSSLSWDACILGLLWWLNINNTYIHT